MFGPMPEYPNSVLFAVSMLLAALTASCAFFVLGRMRTLGFSVGIWRWRRKDWLLYRGYWNIAPKKSWSRLPIYLGAASFFLATVFLFLSAYGIGPRFR
jgi:hypothetical protein